MRIGVVCPLRRTVIEFAEQNKAHEVVWIRYFEDYQKHQADLIIKLYGWQECGGRLLHVLDVQERLTQDCKTGRVTTNDVEGYVQHVMQREFFATHRSRPHFATGGYTAPSIRMSNADISEIERALTTKKGDASRKL